jgi:hypothetical protein
VPVHARHHHVGQDHVRLRAPGRPDAAFSVCRLPNLKLWLQHRPDIAANVRVVVDDEDKATGLVLVRASLRSATAGVSVSELSVADSPLTGEGLLRDLLLRAPFLRRRRIGNRLVRDVLVRQGLRAAGQADGDRRAFALRAFQLDAAAVQLDEVIGEC